MRQQKDRYIYILLTRTPTMFSRAIRRITHDEFTHAAISLDDTFTEVYSFARIYPNFPFYGGFVHENLTGGVYRHAEVPCAVYMLRITEHTYKQIRRKIELMTRYKRNYHYNLLGVILNYFNRAYPRPNYYFCSEFVSELLIDSDALHLDKPPYMIRPSDLSHIDELTPFYRGTVRGLYAAA